MRAHVMKCLAATLLVVAVSFHATSASAQQSALSPNGTEVKGNIAGTIGLGLLGAEVGLMLPPLFKLHDKWWAWTLFPAIGAAGGAVAGALLFEPGSPSSNITVPILGVGVGLVIPALVGALALKSKRESQEMEQQANGGLLRFSKRGTRVSVPSVASVPVYSVAEQARYGVSQHNSLRMSLVSGRF